MLRTKAGGVIRIQSKRDSEQQLELQGHHRPLVYLEMVLMVPVFNILAANCDSSDNSQREHHLPGAGEDCWCM